MSSVAPSRAVPVADFRLTVEEQLLRDSMRDMLAAHWTPAMAREATDDPGAAGTVWPRLAEWAGVIESGTVATCLAAEEAGAALAPGELLAAWAFAGLLGAMEHPLAADAVGGELAGSVALDTGRHGRLPPPGLVLRPAADGPLMVIDEEAATLLPAGPRRTVHTADLSRRFVAADTATEGDRIPHPASDAFAAWIQTSALMAGADALGACRTLLRATIDYAGVRRQFGRPIGTFQAVRHRLVDLALALERATASTYLAAMLVDARDPEADRAVHAARASAGDAVARFTRGAVQLHGAIGYTWEHDVHLYVRRAYVSDRLFGAGSWHRERLAETILEPEGEMRDA
jgi:acyl-CoA dehydrogenase-like protein